MGQWAFANSIVINADIGRVAIVFRVAPGFGTSTRRRCRSGAISAPTAVMPAALAATVARTHQLRK
jgi:hypothetical protein